MVGPGGIEPPLPAPHAGVLTTLAPSREPGEAAGTHPARPRTCRACAPVTPQTELHRTIDQLQAERLRPVPHRNDCAPLTVEQGRRNRALLAHALGVRDDYVVEEGEL